MIASIVILVSVLLYVGFIVFLIFPAMPRIVADGVEEIAHKIFRAKAWILGYDVCYQQNRDAYCKRRRGHFGKHKAGNGASW